jgi:hypothetical protein
VTTQREVISLWETAKAIALAFVLDKKKRPSRREGLVISGDR